MYIVKAILLTHTERLIMKKAILVGMLATTVFATGCSSMKDIPDRKTYAQPSRYQDCAQEGVKGWFWWSEVQAFRSLRKSAANVCSDCG